MSTTNSYESLALAASCLLDIDAIKDDESLDQPTVEKVLKTNQSVLEKCRAAMALPQAEPIRLTADSYDAHTQNLSAFRQLSWAFRAESRCAVSVDDYAKVVHCGLDILKVSNVIRSGGMIIDLLLGNAISGLGIETLRSVRSKLDASSRQLLIEQLMHLEIEQEPFEWVAARDVAWEQEWGQADDSECKSVDEADDMSSVISNWNGMSAEERRVAEDVYRAVQAAAKQPLDVRLNHMQQLDTANMTMLRMLTIDVAVRSYQDATGQLPASLSDLCPVTLAALPRDPFTNQDFIYRKIFRSGFMLYSCGPKQFDGRGCFGTLPEVLALRADLGLDHNDYWREEGTSSQPPSRLAKLAAWIRNLLKRSQRELSSN